MPGGLKQNVKIYANLDEIEIYGIRYSGSLFRQFGVFLQPGMLFKFENRMDGVITLTTIKEQDEEVDDAKGFEAA